MLLSTGAHAVFGCCWHHEHGECENAHEEAHAVAVEHHKCDKHEAHSHDSADSPVSDGGNVELEQLKFGIERESHGGSHECDGDRCQYLVTVRVQSDCFSPLAQLTPYLTIRWNFLDVSSVEHPHAWTSSSSVRLLYQRGLRDLTEVALI